MELGFLQRQSPLAGLYESLLSLIWVVLLVVFLVTHDTALSNSSAVES